MVRKNVYKMKTRSKFLIQTVESWKDTIQTIVGIHYETFDLYALFGGKMTSGYVMRSGLLEIIFI